VAFDQTADAEALESLTRSLQVVISQPVDIQGKTLSLGVSIGSSQYPKDADTAKELILAADLAAAEVKRTGRGQVIAYKAEFANVQRQIFDLSRELGNALLGNEFKLAFQPIVDARSGEIAAFEVLLRWQHPRLGAIAPDVFIPLAEDTDRICEIGDWVLKQACEAAMTWKPGLSGHLPKVAVNVSVQQLLSDSFALRLALMLEATRLPPSRLDIEVTESLFDEANIDMVLGNVKALRALGVDVHIDDFGTGYSSLSRLHQFPVTAIKIDKSFVAQLDEQGGIIIESAVMIARRFGFKVVAEGVETLAQASTLSALGVDYLQGYYLARPQFEPLIKRYQPDWTQPPRKTA
jgi:diguanylate cyclase